MKHKLLQLQEKAKNSLLESCFYYDGEKTINVDSLEEIAPEEQELLPVFIIARKLCFETSKLYKINNKKDLLKAIKLECSNLSPFVEPVVFYHIKEIGESTEVHFWFVEPDVIPEKKNVIMVIPEPCLAFCLEGNGQTAIHDEARFYWQKTPSFSSHWKQKRLDADGSYQAIAYQDFILSSLKFFITTGIRGCFVYTREFAFNKLSSIDWMRYKLLPVIPLAFVVFQSVYLLWMQNGVNKYKQDVGTELGKYLTLETQYEKEFESFSELGSLMKGNLPVSTQLKLVVDELSTHDTLILGALRSENGRLRLRAKAQSATEILAALNNLPSVRSAQFVESVNLAPGDSSREAFHIEVSFE